jgi:L-lactate dehydrogenase complex protein LldF
MHSLRRLRQCLSVYKNVGFAYCWFISGPIGAIFAPQMLGTQTARELPYASTLCGACADVCPVKIPIPTILRHLRRRVAQGDEVAAASMPMFVRATAGIASLALAQNWIYRFGARIRRLSCRSSGAATGSLMRPIRSAAGQACDLCLHSRGDLENGGMCAPRKRRTLPND